MKLSMFFIFGIPFILVIKGLWYLFIKYFKENSKLKKSHLINEDNPLTFIIKSKFASKAYFIIGFLVTTFLTIFNLCYKDFSFKRVTLVLITTFVFDMLTEFLIKIKCQMYDYDNKKENNIDSE